MHNTESFNAGDAQSGNRVSPLIAWMKDHYINHTAAMLNYGTRSTFAGKGMFYEIRFTRKDLLTSTSAAHLQDNLVKIWASIEEPPEKSYEGSEFWISVKISPKESPAPPFTESHTKVKHPNIGLTIDDICAG